MENTLVLNREFAGRYLFVALLMLGLGGWFGYDGFVKYPSLSAAELYASCHGGEEAPSEEVAEHFRRTAIPRQKQFMGLSLLASALVALVLVRAARFRFSYGVNGFSFGGRTFTFADVERVDLSRWAKKGILTIHTSSAAVTLDAWHHSGVQAVYGLLKDNGKITEADAK
jgi:hypothetical protein